MAFIKSNPTAPAAHDERRRAPRDFAGLVAELDDEDPLARRWAARDLVSHPQASAALVARLRIETDVAVQEFILTSLTQLGDETAVAGLIDCLRSEEAQLRNAAIEAMKALPNEVAPIMSDLLRDADPDVRILAVNVLESLRHPKVEQWLIEVIDRDLMVNVCGSAVDLLGEVGSQAARDALGRLKVRYEAEPYIQFAVDLALKRIAAT
jgi:HEAT repeat protein